MKVCDVFLINKWVGDSEPVMKKTFFFLHVVVIFSVFKIDICTMLWGHFEIVM